MRIRTADPLLAKQVLYQLSYTPVRAICFKVHIYCLENRQLCYNTILAKACQIISAYFLIFLQRNFLRLAAARLSSREDAPYYNITL